MSQPGAPRLPLTLPPPSLFALGACGALLLALGAWALTLLLQALPLTAQVPELVRREDVPATFASTVSIHLGIEVLLVALCWLTGGLLLALLAHLQGLAAGRSPSRAPVTAFSWGLKLAAVLVPLGVASTQLRGSGDAYGPAHSLVAGNFAVMTLGLTLLVLVPLSLLTWRTLGRLEHWLRQAGSFVQTPDTNRQLQRQFQQISHPLLVSAGLLLLPLLFLFPVILIGAAPSIAAQTPVERLIVAQQTPLMQLCALASFAAGTGTWLLRGLLNLLTHHFDPQTSRLSRLLSADALNAVP